jgi:hypothetical protein
MNIARGQRAIWPGGTYMSFLRDFFVGYQPTVDDAFRKAKQIGWTVEASEDGYIVNGVDMDDQPATWQYAPDQIKDMNGLLDHVNSVELGEEYRQEKWGDEWDDPTGEKKQEIREYRTETYYEEEYKPGWKRWLGFWLCGSGRVRHGAGK